MNPGIMRRLRPLVLAAALLGLLPDAQSEAQTTICGGRRYVAGGDDVPAGDTIRSSQTYPGHLLNDHMAKFGFSLFNTAQNGTASSTYISGGQLSTAWNWQPDFITLSVGEQNTPIVNAITSCFDNVRSDDFASAISCATAIQGNTTAFTNLTNDLTMIRQQYKMIMAGRPQLVVVILGLPSMYPQASDVATPIAPLCQGATDTIVSCSTR